MKKFLPIIFVLLSFNIFSQRTLEWSIGQVQVTCNGTAPTEICYPVLVRINDPANTPQLASSTMRFFFDANLLSNFSSTNFQNNYTASGESQSNPNLGLEFDFSTDLGIWVQFDINASTTPIDLSTTPTHVLDFCFDVTPAGSTEFGTTGFLCAPIVFDNNHTDTLTEDKSYVILENEGIDGSYFLNNDVNTAFKADDEVINYLFTEDPTYSGYISPSQENVPIGTSSTTGCIEDVCACPDAGLDGALDICAGETPNESELFAALNGIPDTGGVWTIGGGSSVETLSFLGYNDDPQGVCPATSITASTATVNDEITIIFEDLDNFNNFFTFSVDPIYMYGGLQTDGINDFQGAPALFTDLGSQPILNAIGPVNVFSDTNTYSITINLAQFYTGVPDGANVTGFNVVFQNGNGGDLATPTIHQSCELFIDLVDALKDSNASGSTYTYTIAAANGCPEVSSTVTVTETLDACFAVLEWSIDTVNITCGANEPSQLCYKLMVSTDENVSNLPQLATSSMRLFYDSHLLSDLTIPGASVENGYSITEGSPSGFGDPPDTGPYGTIFGFSSEFGNWVQFEIVANTGNPINLSSTPTHVLDLCFTPNTGVTYPLCAPIVFDNNSVGWGTGINGDDGYLQDPDEGITGNFYVNGETGNPILADDEVINYLWTENVDTDGVTPIVFDGIVDNASDRTGSTDVSGCIQSDCALPLELLSFNVEKSGNVSELYWVTTNEINNDRFEVERSSDGLNYKKIGEVKGTGNTAKESFYTFFDKKPIEGVNYYRLKQIDFDNKFNYSPIRTLHFETGKGNFALYQNVPNPFADETLIGFDLPGDMSGVLRVFDATGRVIKVISGDYKSGYNKILLNIEDIPLNGIYYYLLTVDTFSDSKKMIMR